MFDYIEPPTEEKDPTDYTGLIIGAMLLPVFFLSAYLGKAEMGMTVCIVLGMSMLAIKMRWRLRKHVWFWATVAVILALHVPLLFIVRWPDSEVPTIAFSMPLGIADFLIILGAVGLAEKLFSKNSSPVDDEE